MSSPEVVTGLKNIAAKDGESLEMRCEFTGDPEPQVSWSKNGEPLASSDAVALKYRNRVATLTISEVFPEDEGAYACTAVNSVGSIETKCTLKVTRKDNDICLPLGMPPILVFTE
jgi:hypothetical protein